MILSVLYLLLYHKRPHSTSPGLQPQPNPVVLHSPASIQDKVLMTTLALLISPFSEEPQDLETDLTMPLGRLSQPSSTTRSCVTSGKLLHFSVPWFPHLNPGMPIVPLPRGCLHIA